MSELPQSGYVRLSQIIGNPKTTPPTPAIIPVCASSWWAGVARGDYPAPVKLGPNTTAWTAESIRELIEKINNREEVAA